MGMSESSPTASRTAAPVDGTDTEPALGRRDFVRAGVGTAAALGAVGASDSAVAQAYGGWLSDTSNYEGTVDFTGQEQVTVTVGAGENGVLFDPPAILVDPGTTVVWEWTGAGGSHNVVHEPDGEDAEAAFESELMDSEGATFEQSFESAGTFRYFCSPHRVVGMKGVVAVGSTDDELIDPGGSGGGGGGGPLTSTDLVVLGGAVGLGVALVAAVLAAADRPGSGTT